MSRFFVILTVLLATSGLIAPAAFAKTNKNRIQESGIDSFDQVFTEIKAIDDRVRSARKKRKNARKNIVSAMGLTEGAPLSDALTELKDLGQGKIQLTMDGTRPTLTAKESVPSNVQAGIDAVNSATNNYAGALDDIKGVSKDLKSLNKKVQKFPKQFKDEVGGFKLSEFSSRMKQMKTVKNNIKVTNGIPDRSKKLSTGLAGDMQLVTDTFKD